MSQSDSSAPNRRLLSLCLFTLGWSVLVLQAGGFTTSIQAGMAFLDWPLSNGSINPPGWLTEIDKFAEHSHRLAATGLGVLCIAIAGAHWYWEPRRVVRLAAYSLLGLVLFQGLLGGLRVLLDQLNLGGEGNFKATAFAVVHAINAQVTLAVLAGIALAHTRAWHRPAIPARLATCRLGLLAVGLTLSVIIMGAVMRQGRFTAWVTTPADGLFFPSLAQGATWWINALHRAGALVAAVAVLMFMTRLVRDNYPFKLWGSLAGLIALQIGLGILSIQLPLNPHVRTIHLVVGAALFCSLCATTLLARRNIAA